MNQANPYEAPSSSFEEDAYAPDMDEDPWALPALAGRGSRWGAVFIDGIAVGIMSVLMVVSAGSLDQSGGPGMGGIIMLVAGCGGMLALFAYNIYLLHKNGQTIGKKLLNIKIVRGDRRTRADLGRIIGLRVIPRSLVQMIPFVGSLLALVDILFIFRDDRRCIHDMIADTIVVEDTEYHSDSVDDVRW
jgi:uncharacterized RDD family membrane protein YckC